MDPNVLKWAVDNGYTHEHVGSASGRAEVLEAYNRAHGIGTRKKEKQRKRVFMTAADGTFHDLSELENRKKGIHAACHVYLMANNLPFDKEDIGETDVFIGEVVRLSELLSD